MAYSSQRERITQYIQDTYGTQAEYLWADSPGNAIFRHSGSRKWYAVYLKFAAISTQTRGHSYILFTFLLSGSVKYFVIFGQH